jgi:hypothetical protein
MEWRGGRRAVEVPSVTYRRYLMFLPKVYINQLLRNIGNILLVLRYISLVI